MESSTPFVVLMTMGADTGANTGADTGADTGVDTGAETGTESVPVGVGSNVKMKDKEKG